MDGLQTAGTSIYLIQRRDDVPVHTAQVVEPSRIDDGVRHRAVVELVAPLARYLASPAGIHGWDLRQACCSIVDGRLSRVLRCSPRPSARESIHFSVHFQPSLGCHLVMVHAGAHP